MIHQLVGVGLLSSHRQLNYPDCHRTLDGEDDGNRDRGSDEQKHQPDLFHCSGIGWASTFAGGIPIWRCTAVKGLLG